MTIQSVCFHATIMEIFYRGSLLEQAVASLAHHLSGGGFDTWILEVREAGLSKREGEPTSTEIGRTDGDLSGTVQDAFIQAIIKTATKATEVKRDGIMAVLNSSKRRRHLSSNQMVLVKSEKTSTEEDTVTSLLADKVLKKRCGFIEYGVEVCCWCVFRDR